MSGHRDVIARNVRRLRTARRLSVAELARRADVARATLTDLEGGRANPTLDTIDALARELGTSVYGLLVPTQEDEVVHVRAREAVVKTNGVLTARLLSRTGVADGLIELWHVTVTRAEQPQRAPGHAHEVTEQIYLLDGRLLAGPAVAPIHLAPDELLSFPADRPHVYHSYAPISQALVQMIYPPAPPEHTLISRGMIPGDDVEARLDTSADT